MTNLHIFIWYSMGHISKNRPKFNNVKTCSAEEIFKIIIQRTKIKNKKLNEVNRLPLLKNRSKLLNVKTFSAEEIN